MLRFLAAFALLVGLVAPAAAQQFDDPVALIQNLYAPYLRDEIPDFPRNQLSPTLRQLLEAAEARTPEGDIGPLDFDPFVNGQDFGLTDFSVEATDQNGDDATVVATFKNFDTPQRIVFTLIRRADGWKIDDVESQSPGFEWRLSEILADDPMLN